MSQGRSPPARGQGAEEHTEETAVKQEGEGGDRRGKGQQRPCGCDEG